MGIKVFSEACLKRKSEPSSLRMHIYLEREGVILFQNSKIVGCNKKMFFLIHKYLGNRPFIFDLWILSAKLVDRREAPTTG